MSAHVEISSHAPGRPLYRAVQASFAIAGRSLEQWCIANGHSYKYVSMALLGVRNDLAAPSIRARVLRSAARASSVAAGIAVFPTLDVIERGIIESRIDAFSGNKTQAAKSLGISLKTLYNRLNSYAASTAAGDVP